MAVSDLPLKGKSISDEELAQNYATWLFHGKNASRAASATGMPRKTFADRINMAHMRNIDKRYVEGIVAPGTQIIEEKQRLDKNQNVLASTVRTAPQKALDYEVPPDWAVGKSTIQLDADGKLIQQWARVSPRGQETLRLLDGIKEAIPAIVGDKRATPRLEIPQTHDNLLALRPLPDLHLGMYAWGQETGVHWDLNLAMTKYKALMQKIDTYTPAADVGVILGGGDLLHCDNKRNQTDRSGNPLDVDSRHGKVQEKAFMLLVFQIELARTKHNRVIVRILPGNHDEMFAHAATWFLVAWYRDVEEVEIDTDPGDFWFFEWGEVMLGANHGHKLKLPKLPRVMSTYHREMWGRTKWAYAHGFHLHHKEKVAWEEGGVMGEIHQTPVAADAFHHGGGYADSARTMCSITYHAEKGEQGRWTEPLL